MEEFDVERDWCGEEDIFGEIVLSGRLQDYYQASVVSHPESIWDTDYDYSATVCSTFLTKNVFFPGTFPKNSPTLQFTNE